MTNKKSITNPGFETARRAVDEWLRPPTERKVLVSPGYGSGFSSLRYLYTRGI